MWEDDFERGTACYGAGHEEVCDNAGGVEEEFLHGVWQTDCERGCRSGDFRTGICGGGRDGVRADFGRGGVDED